MVAIPASTPNPGWRSTFERRVRWWRRLLSRDLDGSSTSSVDLVAGSVFVRLPDAPESDPQAVLAASEAMKRSGSLALFGRARARRTRSVAVAGEDAEGYVLEVKPGREDALILRLHAWFLDELRIAAGESRGMLDTQKLIERHEHSWRQAHRLADRQHGNRFDVFVACRIPCVRPAARGAQLPPGPHDRPGHALPLPPPPGLVPPPPALDEMESDRKPGYEVLADVFAELEERIPGKGSRVLLVDSGVDEAALRAEGILRPPAAIEWLDTPRPTRDGPYERSSRPGDRRIGPHGTAMAAAILNIARGATISVLPVLNPEPEAPTSAEWISLGLQIAQGQKDSQLQPIINFSLAYLGDPRGEPYFLVANLDWAIEALQKRGALVVAAVGNNVPATVGLGWPARLSGVVAVGAVVERDGQFRRCPDSCYDPAATDDRDYFWVEEGGHLERGVVVSPGITVAGRKYAGSSVACARACGRLAAWRATQERLTGTAPPPDDMAQSLRQASMDGLEALAFPERGHGWARPVSSTNV